MDLMARIRGNRQAFGGPGVEPKWTHGDKNGIGTAYSGSSRIWFTTWAGIITEVYYPTVDLPQMRDLQIMIGDGETFFHDELRNVRSSIEKLDGTLGYLVKGEDPELRYRYEKEIITDPHLPCVLQHTRFFAEPDFLARMKVWVLCAPHLEVGGAGNSAWVMEVAGRDVLVANRGNEWLVLAATCPFQRASVGFVGASDGWTDVSSDFRMHWDFDRAENGNVALTGEIHLAQSCEFTVGVAFGNHLSRALTSLFQALGVPYEQHRARFVDEWSRANRHLQPLASQSSDNGKLCQSSWQVLLAHEDKTYQGAIIASLSIPWGQTKGDKDGQAGYHLVWVRDLVQSATGLLAAGDLQTAFRALVYLAVNQLPDGSFPQNFWIDGRPYWTGLQLDEVAFPIILAHRLWSSQALGVFDPFGMVLRGAGFIVTKGPVTQQERWEESSGYSPSTLAATIAALLCAAIMARSRADNQTAEFLEEHADFLEANVERWTVTDAGTLLPGVPRHYVRITPAWIGDPLPDNGPADKTVALANRPPGAQYEFPARDIVDAGFLQLVRYGIRRPDDPLVVDSLRVIDALLKVETPYGVVWRRYNNDGYGESADGSPYEGYGQGRAWPLLTGERGIFELQAGHDPRLYIQSMEGFATPAGLLPEQVWDQPESPTPFLRMGRPTASATPLMWAHAEYLKLLRSARDGQCVDLIPEVADRYCNRTTPRRRVHMWTFLYPALTAPRGATLRIIAEEEFRLRWAWSGWDQAQDTPSSTNLLRVHYADIEIAAEASGAVLFTFFWPGEQRWEGVDFRVEVV